MNRFGRASLLLVAALAACPALAGDSSPGDRLLEAARRLARTAPAERTRSRCHAVLAAHWARLGDAEAASAAARDAIAAQSPGDWGDRELLELARRLLGAELVEESRRAAGRIGDRTLRAQALARVGGHLADQGAPRRALQVLGEALALVSEDGFVPDAAPVLRSIGRGCAAMGQLPGARALLEKVVRAAGELEEPPRRTVLGELGARALEAGHPGPALAAIRSVGEGAGRVEVILRLARGVPAGGTFPEELVELTREAIGEIEQPDLAARRLAEVAEQWARHGATTRAEQWLRWAEGTAGGLPPSMGRDRLYAALAGAALALGRIEGALGFLERIENRAVLRRPLGRMVGGCAEAGRYEAALRAGEIAGGVGFAGEAMRRLARAAGRRGDYGRAEEAVGRIEADFARQDARAELARIAARRGDFDRARAFAGRVEGDAAWEEALAGAARSYLHAAEEGQLLSRAERVQPLASALRRPDRRLKVGLSVAEAYLRAGRGERARSVARTLHLDPEMSHVRDQALQVGALLARTGLRAEAEDYFERAIDHAATEACGSCRDREVAGIRERAIESGMWAEVRPRLAPLLSPGQRVRGNLEAARKALKDGRPETARDLMRRILPMLGEVRPRERQVEVLAQLATLYESGGIPWRDADIERLQALLREAGATPGTEGPRAPGAPNGPASLAYFYVPGCGECEEVKPLIDSLRGAMPGVEVEFYNLHSLEGAKLNRALCEALGLPGREHMLAPSVFSSRDALVRGDISLDSLKDLARDARGRPAPRQVLKESDGESALRRDFEELTPVVVMAAGLTDSVNPCAFAVIIFFVTYLSYAGKSRRQIALAGGLYTAAVFVTYLGVGLGLHGLASRGMVLPLVGRLIYVLMAGVLVLAALLSFRDGLKCLAGRPEEAALRLPERYRRKIRRLITKNTRRGLTVLGTVALGGAVALIEFPCTGQVYVPITVFLARQPVSAFGWLVLYNVCFILPLVAVFLAVLFGVSSEGISALFQRHMAKTKFALAVVFAALAGALFVTMP